MISYALKRALKRLVRAVSSVVSTLHFFQSALRPASGMTSFEQIPPMLEGHLRDYTTVPVEVR